MDARAKLHEAATRWNQTPDITVEQASAELSRARGELGDALQGFRRALWCDAQVRAKSTAAAVRGAVDDAEIQVELLVSRIPAVGPRVAMALYNRTHTTVDNDDAWPTRPSNRIDPDDQAREDANEASDYLDCIGVHVA